MPFPQLTIRHTKRPETTRTLIFGNSGSGKSTLAKRISSEAMVAHLDLDTLAWKGPAVREAFTVSEERIQDFIATNEQWVIEGCYASLIEVAAIQARSLIFLNPGTVTCQENCRLRPWEPHKYKSREAQDKNLPMLLDWVAQYESRADEFSLLAHRKLFESFVGTKYEILSNEEAAEIGPTS